MKFSLFQTFKPHKAVSGTGFLYSLLTLALLLTATIFGWFIWHIYNSSRVQSEIQERMIKLAEFRGVAVQANEILATSAKMSVNAEDLAWEARYREVEQRFNVALGTMKSSAAAAANPELAGLIGRIEEAGGNLGRLENRAFELARKGQFQDAREVLRGREYDDWKGRFDAAVKDFDSGVKDYGQAQLLEASQDNVRAVIAIIVIFAISVWAWLAVIYTLQKSRKVLLHHVDQRKRVVKALKKSEAQFRELFENANDIVFTTDLAGRFTSFSKEGEKLTGYSRDEVFDLKVEDLFATKHRESLSRMHFEEMDPDVSIKYEAEIITKTGEQLVVEVNCRLIYEDGQPIGVQGIARDITDRREMAEILKKSEQYQNLFKHANDAILVIEPVNKTVLNVNNKACELYELPPEEFIGRSYKTILRSGESGGESEFSELLEKGACHEFETVHYRSDASPLHILINASVVEYEGLRVILSVNRDITRRKKMEEALRESEQHFRSVANSAQDAIISTDSNGKINFWNEGARKIFGYARQEIIGKSLSVLMPERYRKAHEAGMRRYAETEESKVIGKIIELQGLRKDGSEFPLELSLGTWQTAEGKFFTGIIRDITERQRANELLQENLSILASTFEATTDAVLVVDLNNNILNFNNKFVELWGMPKEVIETRDSGQAIAHVLKQLKNPAEFSEKLKQTLENPELTDFSVWELKDGRVFERFVQPQILDGAAVGRVLSYRDITQRKRAEEERDRFFTLSLELFCTAGFDGYFKRINPAWEKILGFTSEELLARPFLEVVHPDDRQAVVAEVEKLARGGATTSFEVRMLCSDGSHRCFLWSGMPVVSEGVFYAVGRDITDRKLAEETLRQSEERYRSIVETTNEWIWAIDLEGRSTYNNPAIEKVLGYRPEEFLGSSFRQFMHEEDAEKFEQMLPTYIAEKRGWTNVVNRWVDKDGGICYLESNSTPIFDAEGALAGFRGADRDITIRKRTEDALLRSQSALNATQDGVFMFSPDTLKFFYVNRGAIEQTGYSRAELLRMTPLDIKSNFSEKRFRWILARLIAGELDSYPLTSIFTRKDGTKCPVEIILQYVTSETGEDLFVAMVRDITERQQIQDALQKNLSLLTSTFDATAEGILVVDLDNRIVTYNQKFIEIFQIPEEIISTRDNSKAADYVLGQLINADEFIENTRKLIANPEIKNYDLLKFKNGNIYERYNHPQTTDGKVVGRVVSFRDITERKQAEEKLQESQQRYQQLFESNPYPIWVFDADTLQILAVNQESIRHYGYSYEEFLELTIKDIRPPEDVPLLLEYLTKSSSDSEIHHGRHLKKDGSLIEVEVASQAVTFSGRSARLALITDITERRRADAALRESEYKLRMLLESMNEGLSQVGNDQVIEFVNDRFCEMTGYSRQELLGKATTEFLLDEEAQKVVLDAEKQRRKGFSGQYELRLKKKSGEALWVIVGGAPIINAEGIVTGSMGVFTDITERKLAEERLLHDALHDGLTGLANRKLFTNHLQKAIERGRRNEQSLYAVLFLDFDRFKVINDSLGHAAGDSLLKQIARRLESSLRGGDLLARLGGDEFTILLNELGDTSEAIQVAERIKNDLNTPFILGEQEVFISASIGIALCDSGHKKAEDMLRDADIAMYRAKAKGKAQHQIFDQTMHSYAINKLQLETEMHHALQRGEFSLNYQPIINLETNDLIGFEALIRWNHPERGMVLPSDFIPIAEENELVIPLGRWILYESCRQMREWQVNNPRGARLTISVNLSSKQFLQSDLYEQVAAALISTQLDPRCLKLEITESHVMENSDKAVSMMHRLREFGVEISLDDFGTGYSSLSYLHRLPVNCLKIDRSFVTRMVESKENGEIVHTIVKLAQNLKMKVIAEGIETYEQFSQLKQLGCEYGQGYFISAPLKSADALKFINQPFENPIMLINQPIINAELNMQ